MPLKYGPRFLGGPTQFTPSSSPYGATILGEAGHFLNDVRVGDMQNMGIRWLRFFISWGGPNGIESTQTTPPTYDFSECDAAIAKCNEAGIAYDFCIFNPPTWHAYGPPGGTQPQSPCDSKDWPLAADEVAFVQTIVHRYTVGDPSNPKDPNTGLDLHIEALEILNEGFDDGQSSCQDGSYAVYLCQAVYPVVKAINPNILVGAPAQLHVEKVHFKQWITDFYGAGGGGYCDYHQVHHYPGMRGPSDDDGIHYTLYDAANVVKQAAANAPGGPFFPQVWVTEAGYAANNCDGSIGPCAPLSGYDQQGCLIGELLDAGRLSGGIIDKIFLYTLAGSDGFSPVENQTPEIFHCGYYLYAGGGVPGVCNFPVGYTTLYPVWTGGVAPPALSIAPTSLSFSGIGGQPDPAPQIVTLSDTSVTGTAWTSAITYTSGSGWLSLLPVSGTLAGNDSQAISISVTAGSLPPNAYAATITFTAATGGATATLAVTFTVSAPPPVGQSSLVAQDTFSRNNQSGWGTASDGSDTWNRVIGTGVLSIVSNTGVISGAISATSVTLGTGMLINGDFLVRFNSSHNTSQAGLVVRYIDSNNYIRCEVFNGTLRFHKTLAGALTTLSPTAAPTITAATAYWMHVNVSGSLYNVNVWTDGTPEPGGWILTCTDASFAGMAGQYGIFANLASGADTLAYDQYTATTVLSTYYVAPNGNDSSSGASTSPWQTLGKVKTATQAGDTVYFGDGPYNGQVSLTTSGTALAPILLQALDKQKATIVETATHGIGSYCLSVVGDYIILDGFEVTGPDVQYGILLSNNFGTVQHCWVHDVCQSFDPGTSGGGGIVNTLAGFTLSGATITANRVERIGGITANGNVHGISVQVSNPNGPGEVSNNLVLNAAGFGIGMYQNPDAWVVTNNDVLHCLTGGISCNGNTSSGYLADHNTIQNNILYDNGSGSYFPAIWSGSDNCDKHNVFRNNLAFYPGGPFTVTSFIPRSFGSTILLMLNVGIAIYDFTPANSKPLQTGSNLPNADPQFVNYQSDGSGDYHLQSADSPAIDTGYGPLSPVTDYDGVARPQRGGFDVGAFESTPSFVFMTAGGSGVLFDEDTFHLTQKLDERQRLQVTVLDYDGNQFHPWSERVTMTDPTLGKLFTGFVVDDKQDKTNFLTSAGIEHQLDCVDNRHLAGKRTSNLVYSTPTYAGKIVADMVDTVLADEGVIAYYATHSDDTQNDFALGTLTSVVATPNAGGDLELVGSSGSVGASYTSQTSWNVGTFSNVQANPGGDLSLIGAIDNWNSGDFSNQTLYGSGSPTQNVSNGVFVMTSGPGSEARSRLDFAGATWADGGVGGHPATIAVDFGMGGFVPFNSFTYRTTNWNDADGTFAYAVEANLQTLNLKKGTNGGSGPGVVLASHTFSPALSPGMYRVQAVVSGNTHTISVNGTVYITYTDSSSPWAGPGYIALRELNLEPYSLAQNFDNFGVMQALSGTWTSPATSINAISLVSSSVVTWDTSLSTGGTVLVQSSLNGGSTWSTCSNGGSIPGLGKGSSGTGLSVLFRLSLSTGTTSQMPDIQTLQWNVIGGYVASGSRTSLIPNNTYANDTFNRANQSGWGTASDGEQWFFDSGLGMLAIANHTGTVTGASTFNYMRLGTAVTADATATVRLALADSGDTNGILLRYSSAGTHYRAYLGNFNQLVIERMVGNTRKQLASTTFFVTLGTFYWVRFQVQGPALSARAWVDGSKEPDTWLIVATDTSIGTGRYGLFSFPNTGLPTTFDHLTVASIGVGPSLDLTPVGQLGTSFVSWNAVTPPNTSVGVDISLDQGLTWTDVSGQNGGPLPGLNGQPEPTTDSFTSDTSANYTSTTGTGATIAFTLYTASVTSSTFSTADQLYTLLGTPATTFTYARVGTAVGYGELVSQGTTSAWLAGTKLPATPTGKGFFLNSFQLVGQQLQAGSWSGSVSLNCAQNGNGNPHAGSLTADIIVRAFAYNTVSGVYTPIVVMRANSQALTSATTTFSLPAATTAGPTAFGSNDVLYLDYWLNVRTNGNGSSVQDVRTNNLSTDTTGLTGNSTTGILTPGYVTTGGAGANILGVGAAASVNAGVAGVGTSPLNSSGNPYGITIGSSAPDGTFNHQAIVDMQNLGMTVLRYQIHWANIDQSGTLNQNPATYHWNAWDSAVAQCNAAGISIGISVFVPPPQFSSQGNPDVPNYAATMAAQVAQRYNGGAKGTVNIIELGNEDYDNSSGTSAVPLVATMKAVYPAVKAVNPSITVGCAALLQRNAAHYTSFMETLLNPSTGAYTKGVLQTDYLNFHFYTGIPNQNCVPVNLDPTVSIPSWNGGQGLVSITDNHDGCCAWQLIAAKKSQYGVSVPIWLTETGFVTNTNPGRCSQIVVSQTTQWTYYKDVLDAVRASGQVTRIFPFTLGYYDGYGPPNYRDGASIIQGPLSNPQYLLTYNNLKSYIAQFPSWGGGGGGGPITVAPSSLTFTATAGGGNPANQTDVLSNPQGTSQSWSSSISYGPGGSGWLGLTPTSGSIAGNGTANVTVSATTGSLAAGTYTATVTYTSSGTATQQVTFTISGGGSSLLPGEFIASSGASNLVFGSNVPPDYGNPPKPIGLVTTPAIQSQMKAAGVTVLRITVSNGTTPYTDAQINQRLSAVKACGAIPLVIIGHDADSGPTWPFAQHVVSLLGNQCNLYEIFNEPDLNPNIPGWQGYLAAWNQIVPLLSAINPHAAFIGPVLGVVANFSSYLIPWLQGTMSNNTVPDGLSFHDYPCGSQPSSSVCVTKAQNIGNDIASLRALISVGGVLGPAAGAAMPICVTEWNLDWHNPPVSYANQANPSNASYINTWYGNAYAGMVANGCAMACQFDASGNAEGGQADLISVNSPYVQQDGYAALQSAVAQYLNGGGGGSGPITPSPGSLSFAINIGQGNPPAQSVLLTNPQTGTQAWSSSISYGSGGSGWLAVAPSSGSIAGGGSQTITVTATTGALAAGTYTATITYTSSGVVTQNVTFTVSSGGGTTALTAYFSSTPSPITPTANKVYTILGTPPDTNVATQLGNATGFGEVWSQGNVGPWAASGSILPPTGHGFLWGALTLEGQTLAAGTYTGAIRLNIIGTGSVSITADIHCRLFKWNAASGYTAIADCVQTNQTIATTKTVFAPAFTTGSTTAFSTGDKLYIDLWLKVLTNSNPATAQVNFSDLSTDSTGFTGKATAGVTTPGYSPTGGGGGGGAITVSPGVLSFFALSGGGNPPSQTATLTNPQVGSQAWSASIAYGKGSGWLSLVPSSGTVPGSGTQNVTVSVATGNLAVGTYSATITYTSSGTVTQSITFTIAGSGGGGSATWDYDTAHSRLTATGGNQGVYYLNTTPYANIDLLCDMDESDGGGLCWNFINGNYFYACQVADNQSGVGAPGTITLYRTASGVTAQVGQAQINFVRGTYHRVRASLDNGVITVSFDGDPLIVFPDGVPLDAGTYGLYNNGGTARFYSLWTQPLGDNVTGIIVNTRLRLATADSTVTPQVLALTIAAFGPQIDAGALIPSVAYQQTFCDKNLDDLAKKSNYSWWIDQNNLIYFNHRQGSPAPWIAQSNNLGLPSDIELDGNLLVDVAGDVYRNRQVLTGVTNFGTFFDPFVGDSTTTSFTLRYPVVATTSIPIITLNGLKQKVGVKGTSGSQWYYANGDATIAQDTGSTTLTSSDMLLITYVGSFTDKVVVNNLAAQAALKKIEGGTGIVEAVQDVSSPGMLIDAARVFAQALLDRYCIVDPTTNLSTGRSITFKTYRNGLQAGQIQSFFVVEEGLFDIQLLINQIDISLRTQPNNTRLYGYTVQASELPRVASWGKLLADGLLQS